MSQTDVRTFKAASMQEALDIVRREMGPDAVILHTREITPSRFALWRKTREKVEITAGTGVNVRTPRAISQPPAIPAGAARNAPITGYRNESGREETPYESPAPLRTAPAPGRSAHQLAAPPPFLESDRPSRRQSDFNSAEPRVRTAPRTQPAADQAAALAATLSGRIESLPGAQLEQHASIARQLQSIQSMVEKLSRSSASRADDIPGELFQLYTELIDSDVNEDLARSLICRLKESCSTSELNVAAEAKTRLCRMVESEIRCAPPIAAVAGRRKVVALVGPTGVGKTTTIAKLAANFRLRDGIRMGLVTVDTYRIAAVEQLRTYAEIIDLPMKVVTGPREMRRALDELMGLDLILIDTAGRSPRDELKIQELKSLLAEAQVDEVHLVLSLVASARSLEATAENFAAAGTTSMILTKLDEAVGMGALMSVARNIPLPISYVTTGQDVPDDIEHASARRLSRLVLGEDSLFSRRKAA